MTRWCPAECGRPIAQHEDAVLCVQCTRRLPISMRRDLAEVKNEQPGDIRSQARLALNDRVLEWITSNPAKR